jgi:hypothetical protein
MNGYFGIMEELKRQELNEQTSAANIAFIPGQFSSVEKLMRDLAKAKRTYDIEILESDTHFTLAFEGYAQVSVPKPAWKEFFEDFSRYVHTIGQTPGVYPVDLGGFVWEGVSEEIASMKDDLVFLLGETLQKKHLGYIQESWDQIFNLFPGKTEWSNEAVLPHRSITGLAEELIREFGDDLGGIQIFMEKIANGEDLSGEPVFEKARFLYGALHTFEAKGITLVFEAYVNKDFKPFSSVQIKDLQVRESLKGRTGLKVIEDLVISEAGVFGFGDLERIRESVDSIVGEAL